MRINGSQRFAAILIAAALTSGHAAAKTPVAVIELFTSQGCSSCPPADELFAKMAHEPDIITLSLPVDYWDRLGWKDTFAEPAFTERQRAYSLRRGDGQVYTPQAVVNGVEHAIGSRRIAIDMAISDAGSPLPLSVEAKRSGDTIDVSIAGAKTDEPAKIILMPILSKREVEIGRGENAHHKVVYTNIAREIRTLGDWNGEPVSEKIPVKSLDGYDGAVVLVQLGTLAYPGTILGATRIDPR